MLKIVTAPHPILSQAAKPVTIRYLAKQISKINANILKLIEEMKKTLLAAKDPEGVGLAAPQVGKSLQIFLIKPTPKSPIQVFINPNLLSKTNMDSLISFSDRRKKLNNAFSENKSSSGKQLKNKTETKLEGCLSLPNIWGEVNRSPAITLSYLDEKGKPHSRKFTGFLSTIIQHEIDHLNGILFSKRVLEQKGKLYKSHKDEKNEDVFEEIEI